MTCLEKTAQLYDILEELDRAYKCGDFSNFIPLLSEECTYESMWVADVLAGREAVANYLLKKGQTIKNTSSYPHCWIVEIIGQERKHPDLGLFIRQKVDDLTNEALAIVTSTQDGLVSKIHLCIPELFVTRDTEPFIELRPANGDDENEDATVRITDFYFLELSVFLKFSGFTFDEFDDQMIPMDTWIRMLDYWKEFIDVADYDSFAEKYAGIDYASWTVANREVHNILGYDGARIWNRREVNARFQAALQEWTNKYKDSYDSVSTYSY